MLLQMVTRVLLLAVVAFVPAAPGAPAGFSPASPAREPAALPHGASPGLFRYPDVSGAHIVFVHANELWRVPRGGGRATRLTDLRGRRVLPRFSPDGQAVAFTSNHDGYDSLYTLPVSGGEPFRVSHHPGQTHLCDWTPDGSLLFQTDAFSFTYIWRVLQLFTVPPTGGLPRPLPLAYGAEGAISPDGEWLAYTPYTTSFDPWKRYRGGFASDLWLLNLKSRRSRRITSWKGNDALPMWQGRVLYYLSDNGPEARMNVWTFDPATGRRRQVTRFADFDVKWPSIGPGPDGRGEIVFQHGVHLRLLDLATGTSRRVFVEIPADRREVRPREADATRFVQRTVPSPSGDAAAVEARGDIWIATAGKSAPRNLTGSSGSAERNPSWSPDGTWVAFFSDASGEYDLYLARADGTDAPRRVTRMGPGFRYRPAWSPDSERVAFTDNTGAIHVHTLRTGETRQIDRDPFARPSTPSWSPDSAWLAYSRGGSGPRASIWLYRVADGQAHQVTSGRYEDSSPTFDRSGDYLYFVSQRDFSTVPMDSLNYPNFIYAQSDQLLAVPLRRELGPPWNKAAPRTAGPVRIDLDGFEQRAVLLRVPKGSFSNLAVAQGGSLLYVHSGLQGEPSVRRVDFEQVRGNPRQVEPKTIVAGVDGFRMSEDGRKLLVQRDGAWQFLDVAGDAKPGERLNLSGMTVTVEPRSEWRQIYTEAWRMYRDFFYDPGMHGLDWPAVREKYRPMLEACASRDDVNYVLAEMLAELNSSHVIPSAPGDTDDPADPGVRRLGVDFALDRGAYRIARIYDGAPWATEYRSPLRMPGVDVREGDYLLAVNGKPIDVRKDPWAALVGLPEGPITLRVRRGLDPATVREVTVATTPGEHALRYHAFLEAKRAHVERRTGGRVGYILLTDTIDHGMRSFGRQFFAQSDKQALIIDGRWNEGGHHPDRFIEMLDRPLFYYNRTQHGRDVPSTSHTRDLPKCLLINGASLSGGDSLPYFFRKRGLGKLIGTRTTGALRGAGGATPSFIDGGRFEVPHMGLFSAEGEWVVEGEGVPPDIEVEDDPSKMRGGADPQLDAAIALMRAELRKRPATPPKPGTPPPAGRRDRATRTR